MLQSTSISKPMKRRFSVPKVKKSRFYYSDIENKRSYTIPDIYTTRKNIMQIVFINSNHISFLTTDGIISIFNTTQKKILSALRVHKYAFPGRLHYNKSLGNIYSIANDQLVILRIERNYQLKRIVTRTTFKPFITEFYLLKESHRVLLSTYSKSKLEIWGSTCWQKKSELEIDGKEVQFLSYIAKPGLIIAKADCDLIVFEIKSAKLLQKIEFKINNLVSFHEVEFNKTFASHHTSGKSSAIVIWEYQESLKARSIFNIEIDRVFGHWKSDLLLIHFKGKLKILSLTKKCLQESKEDADISSCAVIARSNGYQILIGSKNKLLSFQAQFQNYRT